MGYFRGTVIGFTVFASRDAIIIGVRCVIASRNVEKRSQDGRSLAADAKNSNSFQSRQSSLLEIDSVKSDTLPKRHVITIQISTRFVLAFGQQMA